MNCEAFANLSDLYAEGRLTPARRAEALAHLKVCPDCRLKPAPPALPPVMAPQSLKERLKESLARPIAPAPLPRSNGAAWPVLASAAAYACLALLLAWLGPGVASQSYEPVALSGRLP